MNNHDDETPNVGPLNAPLAQEDICPRCLGELDTGWECNDCGYDAKGHIVDDPHPGMATIAEIEAWERRHGKPPTA